MSINLAVDTAESRGRAVAELVTSHAWRYAAGARPYALSTDELDDSARSLLRERLRPRVEDQLSLEHEAVPGSGAIRLGGMLYFMSNRASDFLPLTLRDDASIESGGSLKDAVAMLREVVESRGWQPAPPTRFPYESI